MANYTENTIKLPDGIELLYTDSGAPDTASYTTLVVLHGSGFNGDGFVRLHDHARSNNLRIIVWNRRGYRGSTKYTDKELDDLRAGRKVFQDRLALQTARFLEHFIDLENTPHLAADRKTGGFILMGWSFGTATTLALFSDRKVIPEELYNKVEPYIMSLALYDPPHIALGYVLPGQEKFYNPFADSDYPTPEETYDNFQHWVSSYYKHPNIESGNPSGLSFDKRTEKRTILDWTQEQKERYFDREAAVQTELPA
ncbi:Alpha/Beta hydrolase protein [Mycena epipterygia]|nr:Alpha/Beta hydrolase protein [Mycena epipterygia]